MFVPDLKVASALFDHSLFFLPSGIWRVFLYLTGRGCFNRRISSPAIPESLEAEESEAAEDSEAAEEWVAESSATSSVNECFE